MKQRMRRLFGFTLVAISAIVFPVDVLKIPFVNLQSGILERIPLRPGGGFVAEAAASSQQVYRWIDDEGVWHYSDTKPEDNAPDSFVIDHDYVPDNASVEASELPRPPRQEGGGDAESPGLLKALETQIRSVLDNVRLPDIVPSDTPVPFTGYGDAIEQAKDVRRQLEESERAKKELLDSL